MEVTDEALMTAYARGDAGAFDALYARHKGGLFRFMLRSVRDRASAEELFQDVWMRVIDARARYAPSAKFSTWMYTIAHHRLVDHWRRKGLAVVSLEEVPEVAASLRSADGEEPQKRAELREAMARLRTALESLPLAQREVFLLREEGGLSVPEIAAATGVGEEAAKSRLRYALAKLKEALGDD